MTNAAIVRMPLKKRMELNRTLSDLVNELPDQGKGAFLFSFDQDEDLLVFIARGWMSQTFAAEVRQMINKKRELPS